MTLIITRSAGRHGAVLRIARLGKCAVRPIHDLCQIRIEARHYTRCQISKSLPGASFGCPRHGRNHDSEGVGRVRNQIPQLRFPV